MSYRAFNPEMLTLAREYRGISQSALSEEAGLSQGHLSKFEHGLIVPDDRALQSLADALELPVGFFKQSGTVVGSPMSIHAMFRKRASVGKRAVSGVVAQLNIRLFNLRAFLRAVDIEPTLPLPDYEIEGEHGSPEQIAEKVRRAWKLQDGPIENLARLVEAAGIVIFWCDFGPASIDGVSLQLPDLPPCVFLNKDRPADRVRFSLAHELGHLVMHAQPSDTMEDEANQFASALLMPRRAFAASCARRIDIGELARLKMLWRVSMQAALYRAKSIGILSDNQSSYLWRQMSSLGYRKCEPANTEFAHDQPSIVRDLLKAHREGLGYSLSDLAAATNLSKGDFERLYDVREPQVRPTRPTLRVVK